MTLQTQLNRIINYFRGPQESAKCAKERLQIIIAHERGQRDQPDYLADLQKDILAVIAKYVDVEIKHEDVKIELERQQGCSILELNVTLPSLKKN